MFKNLMSFAMVRTNTQALGFYLAYSLIAILIGGIFGGIGAVVAVPAVHQGFAEGVRVGAKWGAISVLPYILFINLAIVVKKKLGIGYYILSLVSLILAIIAGALLGLIPAAFMTTRQGLVKQAEE